MSYFTDPTYQVAHWVTFRDFLTNPDFADERALAQDTTKRHWHVDQRKRRGAKR
jgi:hypothetical protein